MGWNDEETLFNNAERQLLLLPGSSNLYMDTWPTWSHIYSQLIDMTIQSYPEDPEIMP